MKKKNKDGGFFAIWQSLFPKNRLCLFGKDTDRN